MKRILNDQEIKRAVTRISHEILERNENYENIVFLGIVTRGFELGERLSNRIKEIEGIEIPVYKLDVRNYRDDLKTLEKRIEEIGLPDIDANEKNIIIVDDVIYTGRTTRAALDAIVELGRPSLVQLVALVDRGHREFPIRPDYIGKNIPTSKSEKVVLRLKEVDGEDAVYLD